MFTRLAVEVDQETSNDRGSLTTSQTVGRPYILHQAADARQHLLGLLLGLIRRLDAPFVSHAVNRLWPAQKRCRPGAL